MSLVRWDPFRELEEVSTRLSRFFAQAPARLGGDVDGAFFADWAPAIDVQENEKEYLLKADLPDVKKEDVKVDVKEGVLCIEGERKLEKEEKGKKFHRIERAYGKFVRRLPVPSDVDEQKIAADVKDGVLNVHMPKSAVAKPKSINITVA
jgi:HSP20 family protein